MTTWWNSLASFQQVTFIIAVATSLIMVIQIIMTFIGGMDDASFEADTDVDASDTFNDSSFGMVFGLRILSIRSMLAFFSIGSWIAFACNDSMKWWGALLIGLVAGTAAAFLIAYLVKAMEKLQSSGNVEIKNAVGKTGEVYLKVPAKRGGTGKVNVVVQERLSEFEAVTDSDTEFKTGTIVKIVGLLNESTLVVAAE